VLSLLRFPDEFLYAILVSRLSAICPVNDDDDDDDDDNNNNNNNR